jgi:putative tryptophan/tyrosine transport system substrate-binding protein
MWLSLKRLALGFFLLIVTSSFLLVADWHRRKPVGGDPPATTTKTPGGVSKKWQLHLVEYTNVSDVEEAEQGVLSGLKESGLVEGRDYAVTIRNAQGDMGTVSSLIDASLTEGADMLITLSTPTLQAAVQRVQKIPVVFTFVSSGVLAGAGRTDEDHLPNVTGVYLGAAYQEMLTLIRQFFPHIRSLGTLFVPAEINSVYNKDVLIEEAQKVGIAVLAVAANTSSDVPDAALALSSRQIDAWCQVPGNLTASAFPSIATAAQRAKQPIFAFQSSQIQGGAMIAFARDYSDGGREAALIAARIMRGENPATIPFQLVQKTTLIVNLAAAQQMGIVLSPALIQQAGKILGQ